MARSDSNIGIFNDFNPGEGFYVKSDSNWVGGGQGSTAGQSDPGVSIAYTVGNIVHHNGALWTCLRNNDNVEPGTSDQDWEIVGEDAHIVFCETPAGIAARTDVTENDIWIDSTDGRTFTYIRSNPGEMPPQHQWFQLAGKLTSGGADFALGTFDNPVDLDLDFAASDGEDVTSEVQPNIQLDAGTDQGIPYYLFRDNQNEVFFLTSIEQAQTLLDNTPNFLVISPTDTAGVTRLTSITEFSRDVNAGEVVFRAIPNSAANAYLALLTPSSRDTNLGLTFYGADFLGDDGTSLGELVTVRTPTYEDYTPNPDVPRLNLGRY